MHPDAAQARMTRQGSGPSVREETEIMSADSVAEYHRSRRGVFRAAAIRAGRWDLTEVAYPTAEDWAQLPAWAKKDPDSPGPRCTTSARSRGEPPERVPDVEGNTAALAARGYYD